MIDEKQIDCFDSVRLSEYACRMTGLKEGEFYEVKDVFNSTVYVEACDTFPIPLEEIEEVERAEMKIYSDKDSIYDIAPVSPFKNSWEWFKSLIDGRIESLSSESYTKEVRSFRLTTYAEVQDKIREVDNALDQFKDADTSLGELIECGEVSLEMGGAKK